MEHQTKRRSRKKTLGWTTIKYFFSEDEEIYFHTHLHTSRRFQELLRGDLTQTNTPTMT